MRWSFVLLLVIASVGGCKHEGSELRPSKFPAKEFQNQNRMLINPSTDLFGV